MTINQMIAELTKASPNNLGWSMVNLVGELTKESSNRLGLAPLHLVIPDMPSVPITEIKIKDGVMLFLVSAEHFSVPAPNVVIEVSGGVVQNVTSDHPIKYLLLDHDNEKADVVEYCPSWNSSTCDVERVEKLVADPMAEVEDWI